MQSAQRFNWRGSDQLDGFLADDARVPEGEVLFFQEGYRALERFVGLPALSVKGLIAGNGGACPYKRDTSSQEAVLPSIFPEDNEWMRSRIRYLREERRRKIDHGWTKIGELGRTECWPYVSNREIDIVLNDLLSAASITNFLVSFGLLSPSRESLIEIALLRDAVFALRSWEEGQWGALERKLCEKILCGVYYPDPPVHLSALVQDTGSRLLELVRSWDEEIQIFSNYDVFSYRAECSEIWRNLLSIVHSLLHHAHDVHDRLFCTSAFSVCLESYAFLDPERFAVAGSALETLNRFVLSRPRPAHSSVSGGE